jgi:putative DNA primase/helicase
MTAGRLDPVPLERAERMLSYVAGVDDRATWVKMAMVLRDEYGDAAFDAWDQWSQSGASYNARDARDVWRSCKGGSGPRATIGTLIAMAKEGGWRPEAQDRKPVDPAEAERVAAQRAARQAESAAEREREAADAASKADRMWAAAGDAVERGHPYLTRKLIPGIGARVLRDQLLIPMRHGPGSLVGLQVIQPDGSRKFLTGTPAAGAYMVVGKPSRRGRVIVCEGYATGVSIHVSTQACVVVAFSAGNLVAVASKMRAALPEAELIVASDDDAFTDGNPGRAAAAATGLPVAMPVWAGERGEGTDFNDLHASEGLAAVAARFESPRPIEPEQPRAVRGVVDNRNTDKPASVGRDHAKNAGSGWRADSPPARAVAVEPPADADDPQDGPDPAGEARQAGDVTPRDALAEIETAELLPAVSDEWAPQCSDDDLAARHLKRMGSLTLWCETWGRWLVWQGDRWQRDETLAVQDQVRQTLRQVANDVLSDPDIKPDKRAKQAERIASWRTVQSVERMARTYRHVATHPDEWDQDLWALNTPGGVVDLRTGSLRPHSASDRFTKITAVSPVGDCPTWLRFLDQATGGDVELQGFLRRMCGYALTGEVREHALFFVYGTGGNGKGTFLNTITHIMGDYQRVSGAETFTESPGERHTTELARLQGARMVTAQETEEGKRWAESRIKALTGGDPITARFMRQDDFTYLPQFKLVIVGNHKPAFRSVDDAIRRRLHLIPFTTVIPAGERDPMLAAKLKAEAGGILAWMIQGCIEWAQHGLKPPAIVRDSTEAYLGAEDSLQQWLDECCEIGPGFASSRALFVSWSKWCEASGEYVGTTKRLLAKLESRGIKTGQRMGQMRGCTGIRVMDDGGPLD